MSGLSDLELWHRIQSYQLDHADIDLPFSERLARENGWTPEFSAKVCDEYKKFIYLVCISKEIITPSREVDEAWHLHLVYTRDYWQRFCRDTLGRDIHHTPTEGGEAESDKFQAAYARTLRLYREEFEADPPGDVWPDVAKRFTVNDQPKRRVIDGRIFAGIAAACVGVGLGYTGFGVFAALVSTGIAYSILAQVSNNLTFEIGYSAGSDDSGNDGGGDGGGGGCGGD